jgi:hypothetical protein
MADRRVIWDPDERWMAEVAKTMGSMPRIDPVPPEVVQGAVAAILPDFRVGISALIEEAYVRLGGDRQPKPDPETFWLPPVPTAKELAETDKTLRTKVLQETTEQELEEAAREVTRDPVKLMRANYLAGMIKRATGLSSFTPWVAFVFIFWICMTLNPAVVGALGTALAAVAIMQGNEKGD